jgi:hypothetical protein
MKASALATAGGVALILIVAITLSVNAIVYGASTNALLLLIGFAGTQVPTLLRMSNVENKIQSLQEDLPAVVSAAVDTTTPAKEDNK